jgi:cytochrome c2
MKNTPTSSEIVNNSAPLAVTATVLGSGSCQDSLSFYISHTGSAIRGDMLPLSTLVDVQKRSELMAYLRTLDKA